MRASVAVESAKSQEATLTYDPGMTRKEKAAFVAPLDLHRSDEDGNYPLHYAIDGNDSVLVELMIKAGAALEITNLTDATPLILACNIENPLKIIKVLLDAGANVDHADDNGTSPLHWAALSGNKKSVQQLIAAGADVEALDVQGRDVEFYASAGGNPSITGLLQNIRTLRTITANHDADD